jgi:hypothetical protein
MSEAVELLQESLAVILSLQDIIHPQREFKAVHELREEIEEITKKGDGIMLRVLKVKVQLKAWLETWPLVEEIIDTMQEQEAEVTLENARKLWLNVLETELHTGISNSLAALVDKGEIKAEPLPF